MNPDTKNNPEGTQKDVSIFKDPVYLNALYSEKRRPKTTYPGKLALHLKNKYYKETGALLDIGCGRGDMLKAFYSEGFKVAGTDLSPSSKEACKPHPFKASNLEKDPLLFEDNSFDCVFSKSVIEHLHNPMPLLKQANRVLKPGGQGIIMTPSWMHTRWGPFYLDHTHVTPFTLPSLRDAMEMAGFKDIKVIHFYQLPFLWIYPIFIPAIRALASVPFPYRPMYETNLPQKINTFIRFSKEVMLLAYGRKN